MKSTHRSAPVETVATKQSPDDLEVAANPQGIGMAVAFDWGLVVQILANPFVLLLLGQNGSNPFSQLKVSQPWSTVFFSLLTLPFAAILAIFGEGVRRGWRWAWGIQLVFNSLLTLVGFSTLYSLWQESRHGNYWSAVTAVILLVFSPLIVFRLSRPSTRIWFKTVTSASARQRHGGVWPIFIALWAIAGGILQAIAALMK